MRADLHVHSCHSSQSGSLRFLRSRDCYSAVDDVYRTARARGMDLVTITDHDSLDGCLEFLDRHPDAPDFIAGEEVSCRVPDFDIDVHLGVYGMTEALHRDVQPLRQNVFDVIGHLRQARVFFAVNHLLHFYREQAPLDAYLRLLHDVPALEARNGAMLPQHNLLIERVVASLPHLGMTAGSDAHTLRRIGTTWTDVPGATSAAGFLTGLVERRGQPGGAHGNAWAIAGDVYGVVARYLASLAGYGPLDHRGRERLACAAFCLASLPFQFMPWVLAVRAKAHERQQVADVLRALESRPDTPGASRIGVQAVE